MSSDKYIEVDKEKINKFLTNQVILIVTATDLETKIVHEKLSPADPYKEIVKFHLGDYTCYLAMLRKYMVVHVQCRTQGSLSRDGAIKTITDILHFSNCKVVVMIGIAFGMNDPKQEIGDVLLSKSIIPYNSKRIGIDKVVGRGMELPSSKLLFDRFNSFANSWKYNLGNRNAYLIPTRLISGEELIDNNEYRNNLASTYPDSQGGEMEGVGLAAACDSKVDWILVKGICDFADGNKKHEKEKRQEIAAMSALSLCEVVFDSETSFSELQIRPYSNEPKNTKEFGKKLIGFIILIILIGSIYFFKDHIKNNNPQKRETIRNESVTIPTDTLTIINDSLSSKIERSRKNKSAGKKEINKINAKIELITDDKCDSLPCKKFTIHNMGSTSILVTGLKLEIVSFDPISGVPEPRILKPIVNWVIEVPKKVDTIEFKPNDPIEIPGDKSAVIIVTFLYKIKSRPVNPDSMGIYKYKILFKVSENYYIKSELLTKFGK